MVVEGSWKVWFSQIVSLVTLIYVTMLKKPVLSKKVTILNGKKREF